MSKTTETVEEAKETAHNDLIALLRSEGTISVAQLLGSAKILDTLIAKVQQVERAAKNDERLGRWARALLLPRQR